MRNQDAIYAGFMKRSVSAIRGQFLKSELEPATSQTGEPVAWQKTKIGKVQGGFFADRQFAMDTVRKNQSEMEVENYASNDEEEPAEDDDDDLELKEESAAAPRSAFVLDAATRSRLHKALDSLVGKALSANDAAILRKVIDGSPRSAAMDSVDAVGQYVEPSLPVAEAISLLEKKLGRRQKDSSTRGRWAGLRQYLAAMPLGAVIADCNQFTLAGAILPLEENLLP
jgi:hypothetical protein